MAETPARLAWLAAHKEELRAWHRAYEITHRVRIAVQKAARRRARIALDPEAHKATVREKMAEWRAKNPEKARESNLRSKRKELRERAEHVRNRRNKWNREHRDSRVAGEQRRQARKKNAPGAGITRRQWVVMQQEYGGRCAYCAAEAKLTMDHVMPISKGGAHDLSNIVPACKSCNSSKHDRTILHWLIARRAAA